MMKRIPRQHIFFAQPYATLSGMLSKHFYRLGGVAGSM